MARFAYIVLLLVVLGTPQWIAAVELPSRLVTTQWVQQHLNDPTIRIVDMREKVADYWTSHLPGAVYLNSESLRVANRGVPVMLMPPEALAAIFGVMGITEKTTVIVYSGAGDLRAPYLIWALDYLEHPSAAIMDGGFARWQRDGFPVTADYPRITATTYRQPRRPNDDVRANLGEVRFMTEHGGGVILDARVRELYTGEKTAWKRAGHIPTAVNRYAADDLNADGTWKSPEELKQVYAQLGITPDKEVIIYCGQSMTSPTAYFTLKYLLGFKNVKNYDGGFNEWSNRDDLPVVVGQ